MKKMTRQQAGRLGGLTAAHRMTAEQRQERARKAGEAALQKLGPAHFVRMNFMRWQDHESK